MIHTNRWSPDTCGCVVEYTWDDEAPQEARIHRYARHITVCDVHAHHGGTEDGYRALLDDHRQKNMAIAILLHEYPHIEYGEIGWSYTPDRKIELRLNYRALEPWEDALKETFAALGQPLPPQHERRLNRALTAEEIDHVHALCDLQLGSEQARIVG